MEQALVDQIAQQPEAVRVPDIQRNPVFGQSSFLNDEQIALGGRFPAAGRWGGRCPLFDYRTHHEFTQEEKDVFPTFRSHRGGCPQQKRPLQS
jgi:hypothetical protein